MPLPIPLISGLTITPSITLADQFTEKVRIKSNDKQKYLRNSKVDTSPNILSPEFRLEMEFYFLRSRVAFQAGYAPSNRGWAYTQLNLGAEVFYKNISLGIDYINRKNLLRNAGYSMEGLTLFFRFKGKSDLL
jgi:hypothetical protein